jgi:hypothetical protein
LNLSLKHTNLIFSSVHWFDLCHWLQCISPLFYNSFSTRVFLLLLSFLLWLQLSMGTNVKYYDSERVQSTNSNMVNSKDLWESSGMCLLCLLIPVSEISNYSLCPLL